MAETLDIIAPFFNEAQSATAFAGLLDRLDSVFAALPVFALGKLLLGL